MKKFKKIINKLFQNENWLEEAVELLGIIACFLAILGSIILLITSYLIKLNLLDF